jgi:hypothetical protein
MDQLGIKHPTQGSGKCRFTIRLGKKSAPEKLRIARSNLAGKPGGQKDGHARIRLLYLPRERKHKSRGCGGQTR